VIRAARLFASAACGVLLVVDLALTAVTRDPWASNDGLTIVLGGFMAAIGLLLAWKQPRNAIGWLLTATALLAMLDSAARLYLVLDYRQHGDALALGRVAATYRVGLSITPFLIALPSILLFPSGRVPSRRWSIALAIYVAAGTVFSLAQLGGAGLATHAHTIKVDIRGNVTSASPGWFAGLGWLAVPYFLGFWLASVGHQVRSWRRATGERRAQLKWLAAGAFVCVAGAVTLVTTGDGTSTAARVASDLSVLAIAAFPLAIGIGILRYRLYEIDRLISRTLSYAIVTALLLALFVGLISLTTDVLPFSSPVGVAASTLAAAALFNPLRRRVQSAIDRRFNRARYDAAATVDAFARRLRNAVDVDAVEAGLRDAVDRAVEPAHLTVWLRSTP
jgi:hypothetical protein